MQLSTVLLAVVGMAAHAAAEADQFGPVGNTKNATTTTVTTTTTTTTATTVTHGNQTNDTTTVTTVTETTTTNTTTTTSSSTISSTSSSTMALNHRIQVSFFIHNKHMIHSAKCIKDKTCNIDCSLGQIDQGAFFFTLLNTNAVGSTECGCKKMPRLATWDVMADNNSSDTGAGDFRGDFYYQFAMNRISHTVASLAAVCRDDQCTDCQIDHRAPHRVNPSQCLVDAQPAEDFEYDKCFPTNQENKTTVDADGTTHWNMVDRDGSWFVRKPVAESRVEHDVCVLRQHVDKVPDSNVDSPITIINYPTTSQGRDPNTNMCTFKDDNKLKDQATYAFTNPAVRPSDCLLNGDNTRYSLTAEVVDNQTIYAGRVDCVSRECQPNLFGPKSKADPTHLAHCPEFRGVGVCPPNAMAVAVARAEGSEVIGDDELDHVPTCDGAPTTRMMTTTSTTTASGAPIEAAKKDNMTIIIVVASAAGLLVGLLGYIGFGILRRRKAKRMTAYAALQDDPTF